MTNSKNSIEALETQAHRLEDEMKYELFKLKRSSKKIATISVLAGVGALSAVVLAKLLTKEKGPSQKVEEKVKVPAEAKVKRKHSGVSSRIKTAALTILMDMGRRKTMDFLNSRFNDNRPSQ